MSQTLKIIGTSSENYRKKIGQLLRHDWLGQFSSLMQIMFYNVLTNVNHTCLFLVFSFFCNFCQGCRIIVRRAARLWRKNIGAIHVKNHKGTVGALQAHEFGRLFCFYYFWVWAWMFYYGFFKWRINAWGWIPIICSTIWELSNFSQKHVLPPLLFMQKHFKNTSKSQLVVLDIFTCFNILEVEQIQMFGKYGTPCFDLLWIRHNLQFRSFKQNGKTGWWNFSKS